MEIDKNLYKEIKEYCDLNGIKAKEYINRLLSDAFMKDKYGEAPFVSDRKKEGLENSEKKHNELNRRVEEISVIQEFSEKFRKGNEKSDKEFAEIVKNIGGEDKFQDIISELIYEETAKNVVKNEDINKQKEERDTMSREVSRKEEQKPKKRKIETK